MDVFTHLDIYLALYGRIVKKPTQKHPVDLDPVLGLVVSHWFPASHHVNLGEFLSEFQASLLCVAGYDFIWAVLRKSLRWIKFEITQGKGEKKAAALILAFWDMLTRNLKKIFAT